MFLCRGRNNMIIDVPVLLPNQMKTPKKPPFKYAGSKARMLKKYAASGFLVQEPEMFVDMFAGSTQVAYWVRQLYPELPIIINDLNDELNQLYRVMMKNTKEYQLQAQQLNKLRRCKKICTM